MAKPAPDLEASLAGLGLPAVSRRTLRRKFTHSLELKVEKDDVIVDDSSCGSPCRSPYCNLQCIVIVFSARLKDDRGGGRAMSASSA